MTVTLTTKERLIRQVRGEEVDRIPALGGWIMGVRNLAALAGISVEEYQRDPMRGVIRAHQAMAIDGMVNPIVPTELEAIRTGAVTEERYAGIEPEALEERANSIPDTEAEVLASFDAQANERGFRDYFETAFATWGGLEPIPNFWDLGGHFPLYGEFGYEAFLAACALYPEAVGKIWWAKSLVSRERAKILLPLYREYNLVPVLFCGEDLCTNRGPMLSPEFLREYYFPTVAMILEPLVDAGIRIIHHCDGDVRPVLQDFLNIGFSGFQGFQYEDYVDLYALRRLRSRLGEEVLLFTGMSCTRTLPLGTPDDVREDVDYFIDATDGGRGMFLFSSNVIGVEVPVENIRAGYAHVKSWDPSQPRVKSHTRWPWGEKHPDCFSTEE